MKAFLSKRTLWLILTPVFALFALSAWAFASPVGSSPDDNFHMVSIWCGQGIQEGVCENVEADKPVRKVPLWVAGAACYAYHPETSAACQTEDFGGPTELVNVEYGNFYNIYPPVYYWVMHLFVGANTSISTLLMRLFNSLLFVLAATTAFLVAPMRAKRAVLYSSIATVVPLGMFIIASVNPSTWAITSAIALWPVLLAFVESTGKKKLWLGLLSLLLTFIGVGARADSALFVGLAIVVVGILTVRHWKMSLWNYLLPAALIAMSVGFFFSANQSAALSSGLGDPGQQLSLGDKLHYFIANIVEVPTLWAGIFGSTGLGWLDTGMPAIVFVGSFVVFAGLAFWGFGLAQQNHSARVRKFSAGGIVLAAFWLYPTYVLVQTGAVAGAYFQPRYVLPVAVILLGVLLLQNPEDEHGPTLAQRIFIWLALGVANALALHENMRRYVTGNDVTKISLDSGAEWWWHIWAGPNLVWILGSLAFVIALVPILLWSKPAAHLSESAPTSPVASR